MSKNAATYKSLPPKELKTLMYPISKIKTPFGTRDVIYADFIASGRPSPLIEKFIIKNVYSKYSNTHSNSTNGICMKNEIDRVRDIIKHAFSVDDTYEILFKGSGSTDCVNFLLNCLNYRQYKHIHVFISTYEHYSNHLPFLEILPARAVIHIIPLTKTNELDVEWFRREHTRAAAAAAPSGLVITSITHCSNLTGYFTPVEKLKKIIDASRQKNPHTQHYFMTDMACSAPYIAPPPARMFDAIFLSPHKFIGGVGCPGVLIARTCLFHKSRPVNPGGSCVKKTYKNRVEYSDNIEVREQAGTPAIVGIIKFGQCILLKQHYLDVIQKNEEYLTAQIDKFVEKMRSECPAFFVIPYCAAAHCRRLPILAFAVKGLHYNFLVVLLNDIFGIQTRGGKSCDGLFMDYVKEKYGVEGFCRVSFHWTMTQKQVASIFRAIEYVAQNGAKYLEYYTYNPETNLFCAAAAAATRS